MSRRIVTRRSPKRSTSEAQRLAEIFHELERDRKRKGLTVEWAEPAPNAQLEGQDNDETS